MAALVRIAAHLGAVFAAHVAFQFMNRRGLWSPHDVQRHGLVGVAAKAADFEISEASVESITERWRRLRRSFVTKHPLIPCFTGKAVGFLAGLPGPFSRRPDRTAVDRFARFGAHSARMRLPNLSSQATRTWGCVEQDH